MRDAFAVLFFVSVGMLFNPEIVARGAVGAAGDLAHHCRRQVDRRLSRRAHLLGFRALPPS